MSQSSRFSLLPPINVILLGIKPKKTIPTSVASTDVGAGCPIEKLCFSLNEAKSDDLALKEAINGDSALNEAKAGDLALK